MTSLKFLICFPMLIKSTLKINRKEKKELLQIYPHPKTRKCKTRFYLIKIKLNSHKLKIKITQLNRKIIEMKIKWIMIIFIKIKFKRIFHNQILRIQIKMIKYKELIYLMIKILLIPNLIKFLNKIKQL